MAVDGVWWRQLSHGDDPLFRADPPSDGRWQRGESVGGVYFADGLGRVSQNRRPIGAPNSRSVQLGAELTSLCDERDYSTETLSPGCAAFHDGRRPRGDDRRSMHA